MPGPVVERSDRLAFRVPERDDVEFLQRSRTDPRVRFPLGSYYHGNRDQQREAFEARVEDDSEAAFVACLAEDTAGDGGADAEPTRVGFVAVHNVDGDRAWLTYWLLPEYHGEGYGRETAAFAVEYAFETHAVHGVSAGAYDFNDESRGLLESLGFTADVREVERDYVDGEYHDSYTYSLLRREWAREHRDA
ncbi:GNAT family N-acetyltransferase [Halobacterium yunchengense]|uniref:GNAT family N-acetyltransferase n=1 Tax=Halobacterium yunchengense TaxID=3108497 RepID=UPI00300B1001